MQLHNESDPAGRDDEGEEADLLMRAEREVEARPEDKVGEKCSARPGLSKGSEGPKPQARASDRDQERERVEQFRHAEIEHPAGDALEEDTTHGADRAQREDRRDLTQVGPRSFRSSLFCRRRAG